MEWLIHFVLIFRNWFSGTSAIKLDLERSLNLSGKIAFLSAKCKIVFLAEMGKHGRTFYFSSVSFKKITFLNITSFHQMDVSGAQKSFLQFCHCPIFVGKVITFADIFPFRSQYFCLSSICLKCITASSLLDYFVTENRAFEMNIEQYGLFH